MTDKSAEIGSTSDFEANLQRKGYIRSIERDISDLRQNLDLVFISCV